MMLLAYRYSLPFGLMVGRPMGRSGLLPSLANKNGTVRFEAPRRGSGRQAETQASFLRGQDPAFSQPEKRAIGLRLFQHAWHSGVRYSLLFARLTRIHARKPACSRQVLGFRMHQHQNAATHLRPWAINTYADDKSAKSSANSCRQRESRPVRVGDK